MVDTPEVPWRRPGVADSRSRAWRAQLERAHASSTSDDQDTAADARRWIDQQIRALRDRRVDGRTRELLAGAGITQRTPTATEATFLRELDRWVIEHGTALVPQAARSDVDGAGQSYWLGRRVREARTAHTNGTLSPALEYELPRRAGWTWRALEAHWDASWDRHATILEQHVAGGGEISPRPESGLPGATYRWLMRQRQHIHQLAAPQAERLRAVPGALVARDTAVPDFIAAAQAWLAEDDARTMVMLQARDTVTIGGQQVPVGKRAVYYRRRYNGLEGDHPLPAEEIDAIAALRGWSWAAPPRGRRPAQRPTASADGVR